MLFRYNYRNYKKGLIIKPIYIEMLSLIKEINQSVQQKLDFEGFEKEQKSLLEKLNLLLDDKQFNINEPIETDNIPYPYKYTTPLFPLLLIQKNIFIKLVFDKFLNQINQKFTANSKEFDLLEVTFLSLYFRNAYLETLTPLFFKFEDLNFLNQLKNYSIKIDILEFLLSEFNEYNPNEEFKAVIFNKIEETTRKREISIISSLSLSLNQTINQIQNSKKPLSEKMQNVLKETTTLHNNLIELKKKEGQLD